MIIVRLMGGLGNQMFQYAAGRALALRNQTILKLDLSFLESDQSGNTPRSFMLDHLPIVADKASFSEISKLEKDLKVPRARHIINKLMGRSAAETFTLLYDFDNTVNPRFFTAGNNTFLSGYWQSEQYFLEIAAQIRKELFPGEPNDSTNCQLAEQIKKVNAVSVHVRRGDYVSDPQIHAVHGLCTMAYYQQAMDIIAGQVEFPHFFIFSDEPKWAREHLTTQYPMTVVDHNNTDKPHADLFLMSICKHHIIANSSFSWWGAWLNSSPYKMVISPKNWFASPEHAAEGLVPQEWIRL